MGFPPGEERYLAGSQFRDEYIGTAPRGSDLFHAVLHPDYYPSDIERRRQLEERDLPYTVDPEWVAFVRERAQEGRVAMRRLIVVSAAGGEGAYQQRLEERRTLAAPLHEAGEHIRVAGFETQAKRLWDATARIGPIARNYLFSTSTLDPWGSYWDVRYPGSYRRAFWLMHYQDRQFRGGPVYESPYPGEVAAFAQFWQDVFDCDAYSQPLFPGGDR